MQIQNNNDLLAYLIDRAKSGEARWFGFEQQKIAGIQLCYEMAKIYADKMTAEQIVDYVIKLNGQIYSKLLTGKNHG